jgi:3-carboxy-cis,cis-muconate cycloisomerase
MVSGTLGKIARDIALMMQSELGEAFEAGGPGKGGSSTMPHKRNPVLCASILAAATRVPSLVSTMLAAQLQEHERGLGGWHAEWTTLPELVLASGGALHLSVALIEGLHIDAARMRANLDLTRGLIMAEALTMALAPALGKEQAHHLVEAACRQAVAQGRHLRDVAAEDATIGGKLGSRKLDALFDPAGYLGQAAAFVERVLRARKSGAPSATN